MFWPRLHNFLTKANRYLRSSNIYWSSPVVLSLLATVCKDEKKKQHVDLLHDKSTMESLEHGFLIRQASTVNINAASQLLTVTLVAIQDTSERLREALSKEICLIQQAMEWGNATPPQHWDELVAVRGSLVDISEDLNSLLTFMDYVEKMAKNAAELSYLSGNVVASDAICEHLDYTCRTVNSQKQLNHMLKQESLEIQKLAILNSPDLENKIIETNKKKRDTRKA